MIKNSIVMRNASPCREESVPVIDINDWRAWVIDTCKTSDGRVISIFESRDGNDSYKLFGVLGIDSKGEIPVAATHINGDSYPSFANELPQAHLFERELHKNLGLKPVRKLEGDSMHEVAVGPVHAGVIEPGHFRFQCHGEKVFNLEIHLGYQSKGLEQLMTASSPAKQMILAESIAGDSVIAHGLAHCHAIEGLANREVTQRARIIRAVALELERIANHVGDLGAIANDVGFLPVSSYLGRLKAVFLNILMELCGNRYGRSLLMPGGVMFDITTAMAESFRGKLSQSIKEVNDTVDLMFSTPSVLARLERTGTITYETAKEIGMVGLAARASNLQRDVRHDYPTGMYRFRKMIPARAASGDVHARARVRALEIKKSYDLIDELLGKIPIEKIYFPIENLGKSSIAVSMIEGWRGETVHIARTDEQGKIAQYKIIDPSFHNWTGLEAAMRGGQISDFPLCNKSFNLSYAGYDL